MANWKPVGTVYKKEPEPWGAVVLFIIVLIVIGSVIG